MSVAPGAGVGLQSFCVIIPMYNEERGAEQVVHGATAVAGVASMFAVI